MRVLVTGGTGFVGSHVLRELLRQGHEAVAFDIVTNSDAIADVASKVQVVRGDVQEITFLIDTIKKFGITHVVHTASLLSNPRIFIYEGVVSFRVNYGILVCCVLVLLLG